MQKGGLKEDFWKQCERESPAIAGFGDEGREPQAKECGQPLEDGQGKEMDLTRASGMECTPLAP